MESLDLRGVKCPTNFVKTRLKLDKMEVDQLLEVLLDPGEPVESVTSSLTSEGHVIENSDLQDGGHYKLVIRRK